MATPWRNRTSVVRNSACMRMLVRGSAIELRGECGMGRHPYSTIHGFSHDTVRPRPDGMVGRGVSPVFLKQIVCLLILPLHCHMVVPVIIKQHLSRAAAELTVFGE